MTTRGWPTHRIQAIGLRFVWFSAVLASVTIGPSLTQATAQVPKQGVTITHTEVQKLLRSDPKTGIRDAALRIVPVGGEYNVGIFAIRRTFVNGKPVPDAFQHHEVSEVYQVVSGGGTLVTGGTLEGATEIRRDDPSVAKLMGPTAQGVAINGGTSQRIGPGDMVIIPADTPHGFTDIDPEGISYLLIRIDPHHVLPAR